MNPLIAPRRLSRPGTTVLFGTALLTLAPQGAAQGCLAIRPAGGPVIPGTLLVPQAHGFQVSAGYRYLYADRYFMGTEELPMPPGSQVINEIHSFDLAFSYAPTPRLSLTLGLPFQWGERTTRHEHSGTMTGPQYATEAGGIGDLRLTGDFWFLDPRKHPRGNVSLGIGVKAPTGDDAVEDDFHTPEGIVHRPVDVAIQPGDGGWGFLVQMQGFYHVVGELNAYANGFYLFNPREVNGTASFSPPGSPNQDDVNSVPDQYLGRAGLSYGLWPKAGLALSVGGRIDGLPVRDAFGGSEGFRRPGYVVSVEPGLSWNWNRYSLSVTAPVALLRDRQRSVTDEITGGHGDASFADFALFANLSARF
ncbi:MAG: hypothetical protein HS113_21190 [Verrucomicrobiales bacterium]|nr:hypothetical protein [Verrucomicrobiales bacterium]